MSSEAQRSSVARLLTPRSIAVVGVSPEPGSLGNAVLANLERFGFAGELHLVSRSRADAMSSARSGAGLSAMTRTRP